MEKMTREQWEALCDGCARCCLFKLEDEDSGEIHFTSVVCKLLDLETCRCTRYADRHELVPTCLVVTPQLSRELKWMPSTCAYRRLAEGKGLDWWHPLVSGNPNSVHKAGVSVREIAVSEEEINPDDLEDYVVDWID